MIEELKEIEMSLIQMAKELDTEMSASSLDPDQFHQNLINLLSKYPDSKEMIQFIVFSHDRIVTNHTVSRDIFYDTIKGIIKQKQYLIKRLIKDYEKNNIVKESQIVRFFELLKANKQIIIVASASIAITLLMVALFIIPTQTIEAFKLLKGFTK